MMIRIRGFVKNYSDRTSARNELSFEERGAFHSQRRNCGVRFVPAKSAIPMERKNLLLYPLFKN